ncbi:NADPH-cytochrome P450 reductase [Recurvomyces mirabilis]|uniref:NADPH--cytochrome P450 reductase n=1 Tax=Recurvomyces mirabilis TaxID=574656 RepID=A0AAE0TQN3_9PEZI|nr:NADPH-cytochrome P450 reductase [Recurvomyces mirabilis]
MSWERLDVDDVLVVVMTAIAFLWYTCGGYISRTEDIPSQFWYQVPQSSDSQQTFRQRKAEARNVALVFKETGVDAVIFWGSQSGRAEAFARRLAESLEARFGLRSLAADLNDYDHANLTQLESSHLCGFVLSTHGDGDPPDNSDGFWRAIHAFSKRGAQLSNLRYMLFGLGNSKYRQFNRVAETVDDILERLGGTRIGEFGRGDDANGETEDNFLAWRTATEDLLKAELGLVEQDSIYNPAFNIQEVLLADPNGVFRGEPHQALLNQATASSKIADPKIPRALPVVHARPLWESDERLCLHVELDLGADRLVKYKTGDHLAVWPSNPVREVEQLLSLLGLQEKRETIISIGSVNTPEGGRESAFSPTTIEALFSHYLEICGLLSREAVLALASFAPSEASKTRVLQMSDNAQTFKKEVVGSHLTLPSLMRAVGGLLVWRVPLSFFLEKLKPLQPRYYSISSSAVVQPQRVSITVVVDKPPNPTSEDGAIAAVGGWGLATSYLHAVERSCNSVPSDRYHSPFALGAPRALLVDHKVFGAVRQSPFKLPVRASTPIIMVGSGTGVAPFRAFVQERARRKAMGHEVGSTFLFMGFRSPASDLLYEDEWSEHQRIIGQDLLKIWTAYSREIGKRKVYVQDRLLENAAEIMRLFEEGSGCRMYICGSADMARDVVDTLAVMRAKAAGQQHVNAWIKQLRQSKQLLEDVWN